MGPCNATLLPASLPRARPAASRSLCAAACHPPAAGRAPDQANRKRYQNADDLAATLASVNPNWPQKTLQDALHTHLQMVTDQVAATLHHDAAAALAAYDKGAEHMLMVADVLSSGIVKRFPDRFRS